MPLIPNGDNIEVTNENKMRYLNVLAEYRLCTRIKEETDAFLEGIYLWSPNDCNTSSPKYLIKGLHSIIPDELLAIFDETELEVNKCVYNVCGCVMGLCVKATDVWHKCFQLWRF